jgi:hypothetical protein
VIGQGFPEVVDFVCLSGSANVIEDFPPDATALFVLDEWLNGNAPVVGMAIVRGTRRASA